MESGVQIFKKEMIGLSFSRQFQRISSLAILISFIACGYSDEEQAYLKEVGSRYEDYTFELPDRLTHLELTVDLGEAQVDSSYLQKLYYDLKEPLPKYSKVSWVYLIVENKDGYITSVGSDLKGGIFFFKGHEP